MEVSVNYLAVLVSGIASMIIGGLWYGPLFGKAWLRLSGISEEKINEVKQKGVTKSYLIMFIGSLVMAFVMAHSLEFASNYLLITGVPAGLSGGFWNWLGFVAPVTLGSVLWDGKPWKLWMINSGYYLVLLCVMGVILSTWK
jgi:hypothetical protein